MLSDDFYDFVEKSATGVFKSTLMTRLGKWLARKAAAQDVERTYFALNLRVGNIASEILVFVLKQLPVLTLVKVMLVGLSCRRIPLTSEYATRSACFVECDMEPADAGKQIDELISFGLR